MYVEDIEAFSRHVTAGCSIERYVFCFHFSELIHLLDSVLKVLKALTLATSTGCAIT